MTDAAPADARLKRLRLRSWRRGTREMDLLLGPYADAALAELDAPALDAFEALLGENDRDLYAWISGAEPAEPRHAPALGRIARFHGLAG